MTEPASSFESLLREALAPVEPPDALALRLEETLTSITEMAADELEAWELGAMRDPRNWVRPAAARGGRAARPPPASCCCAPAGARRRTRPTCNSARSAAERSLRDLSEQTRTAARPPHLSRPGEQPAEAPVGHS